MYTLEKEQIFKAGYFWMGGIKVINGCTNQYLNKM